MSTRDDQVEACRKAACWDEVENPSPTAAVLHHAAATLTRDGEMRERLKKLVLDMARDYEARGWAGELSALLKEASDDQA